MNIQSRTAWLAIAAAVALWAFSRTKQGQAVVADAVASLAALGDWAAKVPAALRGVFASAAARYSLPNGLIEAVAYRESRFRQDIITGAYRSRAGAVGIMQIVPKWHPEVGEAGALDPKIAIPYAAKYLSQLFNKFGRWDLALAAYNWGQGNLERKDLMDGIIGDDWPSETRIYVAEITRNAGLA